MSLFAKDTQEIINESVDFVRSNTGINSTGPGSKFRTLLEVIKKQLDDAYKTFDYNSAVGLIHGSNGRYLDYIGDMFGVTRGRRSSAVVYRESNTVKFYVKEGTFGDINSGSDISIPAGTKLWAVKGGNKILFSTTEEEILSSGDTSQYISAKSIQSGEESNVASGSISNHNTGIEGLFVTNITSIDNAYNDESDENFRYRIINEKLSQSAGNNTAIRMAALSVGGVADVRVLNRHFGSSSVAVLVKTTTPTASDAVISLVKDAVSDIASEGVRVIVSAPTYLNMKFNLTVKYSTGSTLNQRSEANTYIINTITDYVNNTDIGEYFYKEELLKEVLNSHASVINIQFDTVKFTKNIADGGYSINHTIMQNYSTADHEKLIMSTDHDSITIN